MHNRLAIGLLAFAATLLLPFAANDVGAQQPEYSVTSPRIDGFDVESVIKPAPGNELVFTLYGSPGGTAKVKIDGASGEVVLPETEVGVYEGTYTIRKRDRITVDSAAIANLRIGNKVVSAILDEPMVGSSKFRRSPPIKNSAAAPKIVRFDVDPPLRLVAGEELILTLTGSPDGVASARIVGVKGKIVLNEIRDGVYEGAYTIRTRDHIASDAVVTGNLRLGSRETSAVLGRSLLANSGYRSSTRRATSHCINCGIIEAINTVEVKGEGTYLGKIAGGLTGVLLGSQVGQGGGTTVAQVAGAVGGAYAGSEIEKKLKTVKHYEVVVRLENGGSQTISYMTHPEFAVGTRVNVENGALNVLQ